MMEHGFHSSELESHNHGVDKNTSVGPHPNMRDTLSKFIILLGYNRINEYFCQSKVQGNTLIGRGQYPSDHFETKRGKKEK